MSYAKTVHNALLAKLTAAQAGSGPLSFMAATSIFPAIYPEIVDIPESSYPALALMPDKDQNKWFTTGNPPNKSSNFRIKIIALVYEGKPGLGLLGDPTLLPPLTGLYDFTSAIKNVLEADQQLAQPDSVQKVLCESVDYKYDFYPVVMAEITVLVTGQLLTTAN